MNSYINFKVLIGSGSVKIKLIALYVIMNPCLIEFDVLCTFISDKLMLSKRLLLNNHILNTSTFLYLLLLNNMLISNSFLKLNSQIFK